MLNTSKPEVVYGDNAYVDCLVYVQDEANNSNWKFTLSKDLVTAEFHCGKEFSATEDHFEETTTEVPDHIEAAYKAVEEEARAAIERYIATKSLRCCN